MQHSKSTNHRRTRFPTKENPLHRGINTSTVSCCIQVLPGERKCARSPQQRDRNGGGRRSQSANVSTMQLNGQNTPEALAVLAFKGQGTYTHFALLLALATVLAFAQNRVALGLASCAFYPFKFLGSTPCKSPPNATKMLSSNQASIALLDTSWRHSLPLVEKRKNIVVIAGHATTSGRWTVVSPKTNRKPDGGGE